VHRGELTDLESLRSGASDADGVIHAAFIHDFSKFKENCDIDGRAIDAIGSVLAGSDRPFIVTSGTALVSPGRLATEDMAPHSPSAAIPRFSEQAADAFTARRVRTSAVRLPPSVHGDGDHGFVPLLIGIAREKGISAYVDEGRNRWSAVHRLDAAKLYRLMLEKGSRGVRYHAVGDEGVPFREIAEAIGRGLNLPVASKTPDEAVAHFGWFAHFAALDGTARVEGNAARTDCGSRTWTLFRGASGPRGCGEILTSK
jgi:nucleoside-diphosphate-sugar epimerase